MTEMDLARDAVAKLLALGADEATALVSEGSHTTILRRDGKVEQATEATTRGLSISLLADEKWSTHGTSDLRPEALQAFFARAVEATRFLEPDPDRRLPDPQLCGRGPSDAALEQLDPHFALRTASERAAHAVAIEHALGRMQVDGRISAAVYVADGRSKTTRVTSGGFADETEGAWFAAGGEITLTDADGRRPEGDAYFASRYLTDLPDTDVIAERVVASATERLGSGPIASGQYPMLLENRVAGRILGLLSSPLSGGSLHHGRSCLAGKRGERIGSEHLTILDDPTVPRGLGSHAWDGDGMVARPMSVVEGGVLKEYYLGTYYARKLGMPVTTGSKSNWVLPVGRRSVNTIARDFDKAILVTGFLGGNSNGTSGDFSFGIRGVLLERGEPTKSLSEMNIAGNTLTIFHKLAELADDLWHFSSVRSPTLLFEDVQFSGS